MPNARPTMHDVARVAGVSLKTVSRVVNNEPRVNRDTTEKVNAAIAALGFRRNEFARQFRTGLTSTIGLITEDISNPFYSQIARGVEAVARAHDCVVITASSEEGAERERSLVHALIQRRVDGLLIVPASDDHAYIEQARQGTPVVFLDRPPGKLEADAVLLENRSGARRGVEHLIAQGHRRIAFISGFSTVYTGAERLAGFRDALKAAGLNLEDELLSFEGHDAARAEAVTTEMLALPDPPTAVFAASNRQSLGVIRAAHRRGLPVALVGFDDFELADVLPSQITVIRYDAAEMGRLAAEMLFSRLAGETAPPKRVIVPVELFTRGMAAAASPNLTAPKTAPGRRRAV